MGDKLKVVLFNSRNKDNKHLNNYKQRTESFLTNKNPESLVDKFNEFVGKGVPGEMSRFYISVNNRDNTKLKKSLLHYLIENDDYDMSKVQNKTVSLASKSENRSESKWLFDFDKIDKYPEDDYSWANKKGSSDKLMDKMISKFLEELEEHINKNKIKKHKTPNGYAIIVSHGFDTREILSRWSNVTLKRDDLLCYKWKTNKKGDLCE